eukprot:jgi/Mesvir1/27800/Mv26402-RA.1
MSDRSRRDEMEAKDEQDDRSYSDVVRNPVRIPFMPRARGSTPVVTRIRRGPPYAPVAPGASSDTPSGEASESTCSSLGLYGLQPSSADEARSAQVAADATLARRLQEQESAEERRQDLRSRERAQHMEDAARVREALRRPVHPTHQLVRRCDLACFQRLRRSETVPKEVEGILQESEFSLTGPFASEADQMVEMTPVMQAREREA